MATSRSRDRGTAPIADYTHLRPLYAQLQNLGELEAHAVDTTTASPEEALTTVRDGLRSGRFRLAEWCGPRTAR